MKKRILIADGHPAVRRGMRHILSRTFAAAEFGEAQNPAEIFEKLDESNWGLLIFDIDMPGGNGLDILKKIKARPSQVHVLIFTFFREDQYAAAAFEAGACGYVSKFSPDALLVSAVKKVLADLENSSKLHSHSFSGHLS